jgi:hypothetical protein
VLGDNITPCPAHAHVRKHPHANTLSTTLLMRLILMCHQAVTSPAAPSLTRSHLMQTVSAKHAGLLSLTGDLFFCIRLCVTLGPMITQDFQCVVF